jgi:light-regulated signal transduction histidine kinase (bacteriophytochrome)
LATVGLLLRNRNRLNNYYQKLAYINTHLNELVRERTAELNQYSEELKRSNQELQNFAFVASHDLQEPLRKIRAFGDRLNTTCADQLNEKGQDYLARMMSAAERMSVLISDILRYSRVTQQVEAMQNVALETMLEEAIGNLEIAINESGASIETSPLPIVMGDKAQLTQVFSNLLSNSIKFRQSNTPLQIKITSTTRLTEDGKQIAEIKVADNGVGFDSKYVSKVFEIFQRLHSKDAFSGTGIGLAVCKKIIERHGGTITADAEVGLGATFFITLPIAPNGALTGVTNGT